MTIYSGPDGSRLTVAKALTVSLLQRYRELRDQAATAEAAGDIALEDQLYSDMDTLWKAMPQAERGARERESTSRWRWSIKRRKPYTKLGIRRQKCIRCGDQAHHQWQICSDGNNYRPLCLECDIDLNRLVLEWVAHPDAAKVIAAYNVEARQ